MGTGFIDALVRKAGRIDRRASLTLGTAALVASAMPTAQLAVASPESKKAGRRCKRQRGACLEFVQERCIRTEPDERLSAPNDCVSNLSPCCNAFEKCQLGAGLECLFLRAVK